MKITFSDQAWEDYVYWQQTNKNLVRKVNTLIKEIKRTPFEGTGKPEPLKHNLAGFWSRRITEEHRLVYEISEDSILVASCRYHYD